MVTPLLLSRPLTPEERRLLFRYCLEHPIARCPKCAGEYKMSELGTDLFGTRSSLCRSCRVPLTDSIRAHLASCTFLRVQVAAPRPVARRSTFTPADPDAVRRRFEQVRARTLDKLAEADRKAAELRTKPDESPVKAPRFGQRGRGGSVAS